MTRRIVKGGDPGIRNDLSRREFVTSAAALGVAGTVAGPLLSKAAMAADTPKQGGHLILGIDGASSNDSLDPLKLISSYQDTVGFQWGNCLVELDENNQAIPELATSWEPSADATEWVFKIREGVQFHNGKDLVADDVVASINLHRGPETKSPAKPFVQPIEEIKATGKHEVTFTLKEPNVDLPYLMADFHLLIIPADGPTDAGIGTGGYIIDEFTPGVSAKSHRNPNYWKEGRAHVDSVETVAVNDVTARTNGVRDGSLHFEIESMRVPATVWRKARTSRSSRSQALLTSASPCGATPTRTPTTICGWHSSTPSIGRIWCNGSARAMPGSRTIIRCRSSTGSMRICRNAPMTRTRRSTT